MAASFSSRTALLAAIGVTLAAGSAHADGPSGAPAPQPYPGAYAPYAAPTYGYAAPAWGSATPVATERNSTGMMAGGITLVTVGSVGSIIGAALLAVGTSTQYDYPPCAFDSIDCSPTRVNNSGMVGGGATMVAISTAALVVGIPLLAVGVRKVPARPDAASLVPEVRLGAATGTLRWWFY